MKPAAIYVWLVPSEEVLEQPGGWRIRKWDTEPFPEANYTLPSCFEAARDGERYRWLRENGDKGVYVLQRWQKGDEHSPLALAQRDELDTIIDREIACGTSQRSSEEA